jgi:type I restriction enzyme, S subunit
MVTRFPVEWEIKKLREVVESRKGKKPNNLSAEKKEGFHPYILIDEMEGNPIRHYTNDRKVPLCSKDDVLLVWDGSIGKCRRGLEGAIGSTIMSLKPRGIDPGYLESFIKFVNPYIKETSTGSGLQHINKNFFKECEIPVPPFDIQKAISSKLDNLLNKVSINLEKLNNFPQTIKKLQQSILAAAVSGELTKEWRDRNIDSIEVSRISFDRIFNEKKDKRIINEKYNDHPDNNEGWIECKLGSLFYKGDIFDGPFGSNLKTSDYTDSGVRVIRLENIEFLSFLEDKKSYISEEKFQTLKRHRVYEGDILFSSFISDKIRTTIIPMLDKISIAKADCFCLRPIDELIDRQFLVYLLSSNLIFEKLQKSIHGATRPRINTTQLKHLLIPVPSLIEQREFVNEIKKWFAKIDQIESRFEKVKLYTNKLPQSILSKAFRGEL